MNVEPRPPCAPNARGLADAHRIPMVVAAIVKRRARFGIETMPRFERDDGDPSTTLRATSEPRLTVSPRLGPIYYRRSCLRQVRITRNRINREGRIARPLRPL